MRKLHTSNSGNFIKKYSEIIVTSEQDNTLFENFVDRIESEFRAKLVDSVSDLDSAYLDFKIKSEIITLHRQTFIGISVFPKELEKASSQANYLVEKIGFKLKYSHNGKETWVKMRDDVECEINYLLANVLESRTDKGNYIYRPYKKYSEEYESHDHCEICSLTISCMENNEAWFSDKHTVCIDCYDKYIAKDDYIIQIEDMERKEKTATVGHQ